MDLADSYDDVYSGGECSDGLKLAVYVRSKWGTNTILWENINYYSSFIVLVATTTTPPPTMPTTSTSAPLPTSSKQPDIKTTTSKGIFIVSLSDMHRNQIVCVFLRKNYSKYNFLHMISYSHIFVHGIVWT